MVDANDADLEPEAPENSTSSDGRKGRRSFLKTRRELDEKELSSPAVQRLLLDEVDRLDSENKTLNAFRELYHTADKRVGILEERVQRSVSQDIIIAVSLSIGAALLTAAPQLWHFQPFGYMSIAAGLILIIGCIVARTTHR